VGLAGLESERAGAVLRDGGHVADDAVDGDVGRPAEGQAVGTRNVAGQRERLGIRVDAGRAAQGDGAGYRVGPVRAVQRTGIVVARPVQDQRLRSAGGAAQAKLGAIGHGGIAGGRAQRVRVGNRQAAFGDGRRAAVAVVAPQHHHAGAFLVQRAGAADRARIVQPVIRPVPDQRRVVDDVGVQRTRGAVVADLQRAGAVGHGRGEGVGPGQLQDAGAGLGEGARARDDGRIGQRDAGIHLDEPVVHAQRRGIILAQREGCSGPQGAAIEGDLVGIGPAGFCAQVAGMGNVQHARLDGYLLVVGVGRVGHVQRARANLGDLPAGIAAHDPAQGQELAAGHANGELVVGRLGDRDAAAHRRIDIRLDGLDATAFVLDGDGVVGQRHAVEGKFESGAVGRRAGALAEIDRAWAEGARVADRDCAVVDVGAAVIVAGAAQDEFAPLVLDQAIGAGAVRNDAVVGHDLAVRHGQERIVPVQRDAAVGVEDEAVGEHQRRAAGQPDVLGGGTGRRRAQRPVRADLQRAAGNVRVERVGAAAVVQRDRAGAGFLHVVRTRVGALGIRAVGDLAVDGACAVARAEFHVAEVRDRGFRLPVHVRTAVVVVDRIAVNAICVSGTVHHRQIVLGRLAHDVGGEFAGGEHVELQRNRAVPWLDAGSPGRGAAAAVGHVQVAGAVAALDIAAGIAVAVGPRAGRGAVVERRAQDAVGRVAPDADAEAVAGLEFARHPRPAAVRAERPPRHRLLVAAVRPLPDFVGVAAVVEDAAARPP